MNQMPSVLVVDDDQSIRDLLKTRLTNDHYHVVCCEDGAGLKQALCEASYDLILLDLMLPDADGITLMKGVLDEYPNMSVIIITAHGGVQEAVQAMREGAYDFVQKPIDFTRLTVSAQNAIEHHQLKRRITQLEQTNKSGLGDLVGGSASMQVVYRIIETVAPTDANVFITGESGTGKELVVQAIHQLSHRSSKELVDVNCAAIPNDLLESELFGHEANAFTGANERFIGRCEQANRSTLFLDEIAEMNYSLQAKLLRFLQDHTLYRVGGRERISVDLRVVSATNQDPAESIKANRFREDLFYRLNVVHLPIPPLRDRLEDIPELAEHFMQRYSTKHKKAYTRIASSALDVMCSYSWPGNVRELENSIQQIIVLNAGTEITADLLPLTILESVGDAVSSYSLNPAIKRTCDEIIPFDTLECDAIDHALRVMEGNVTKASKALRISPATIYRKIRDYNLVLSHYKLKDETSEM